MFWCRCTIQSAILKLPFTVRLSVWCHCTIQSAILKLPFTVRLSVFHNLEEHSSAGAKLFVLITSCLLACILVSRCFCLCSFACRWLHRRCWCACCCSCIVNCSVDIVNLITPVFHLLSPWQFLWSWMLSLISRCLLTFFCSVLLFRYLTSLVRTQHSQGSQCKTWTDNMAVCWCCQLFHWVLYNFQAVQSHLCIGFVD